MSGGGPQLELKHYLRMHQKAIWEADWLFVVISVGDGQLNASDWWTRGGR